MTGDVCSPEGIGIRPSRANAQDRRYVWQVNNHSSVRRQSIDTDSIPWEDHVEWYADVMSDPNRLLYIVQYKGEDCGVVRFDLDREAAEAEIAIAVEKSFRGRHIGRKLIAATTSSVIEQGELTTVVAHVRPENEPSLKAFEAAGYVMEGWEQVRGVEMVRLEFRDRDG
jgi:RimJ/RimL family protein N-acetyltransferase